MKIIINAPTTKFESSDELYNSLSSHFKKSIKVTGFSDKSQFSSTGATFRFIGGQFVKESGPTSGGTMKLQITFEPKDGVQIDELAQALEEFLTKTCHLKANHFELYFDGQLASLNTPN